MDSPIVIAGILDYEIMLYIKACGNDYPSFCLIEKNVSQKHQLTEVGDALRDLVAIGCLDIITKKPQVKGCTCCPKGTSEEVSVESQGLGLLLRPSSVVAYKPENGSGYTIIEYNPSLDGKKKKEKRMSQQPLQDKRIVGASVAFRLNSPLTLTQQENITHYCDNYNIDFIVFPTGFDGHHIIAMTRLGSKMTFNRGALSLKEIIGCDSKPTRLLPGNSNGEVYVAPVLKKTKSRKRKQTPDTEPKKYKKAPAEEVVVSKSDNSGVDEPDGGFP
ncbi:hypothetical protein CAPTEDRAFT_203956 [Capitella teleta]|uniref:Uncharacterized protein n=1 Tax=Capitella teleta TaxID=283909 RepID=R7TFP2_CAPTE|nr:hypothetical protein CAPTEDRAFT_203956 [Capitella teleta]|eukprot:ELT92292.1 hypothetical protein CAPTEDRAFT_203956 [Capitella teleta]